MKVPVDVWGKELSEDCFFTFEPEQVGIYNHIADWSITYIYIQNDNKQPLIIARHQQIKTLIEYKEEGFYLTDPEIISLTVKRDLSISET